MYLHRCFLFDIFNGWSSSRKMMNLSFIKYGIVMKVGIDDQKKAQIKNLWSKLRSSTPSTLTCNDFTKGVQLNIFEEWSKIGPGKSINILRTKIEKNSFLKKYDETDNWFDT